MIPGLVEQNFRATRAASDYFIELTDKLDEFIRQFQFQQTQFEKFAEFTVGVTFEDRKQKNDPRGQEMTEYRSSIAVARIYHNEPIGWVYGEIEQHVPWIGRKCFAVNPKPNSSTDLAPKVFGCYSFGQKFPFPTAYLVAKQIMLDLAQGDISEDRLDARTKVAELSHF